MSGGDVVNRVDPSGECPENPAALDIFGWRCRFLAEALAARLGKAPGTPEYQKIMSLPYGDLEAITAISTLNDAAIIPLLIRQDPVTAVEALNQWICQRGGLLAALTFVAKGVAERIPVIGWVFPPLRASRWLSQMLAAAKGLLTATELVRSAVETEEESDDAELKETLYHGTTYYDALRWQDMTQLSRSIQALQRRQAGRDFDLGFYTSTNRTVAEYFGNINRAVFGASQGGGAMLIMSIKQRDLNLLITTYSISHNRLIVDRIPASVPLPHVETVFPYQSLLDFFSQANVEVMPF